MIKYQLDAKNRIFNLEVDGTMVDLFADITVLVNEIIEHIATQSTDTANMLVNIMQDALKFGPMSHPEYANDYDPRTVNLSKVYRYSNNILK